MFLRLQMTTATTLLAATLAASPAWALDIVDTATSAGTFGSWIEMLRETGMEKTLKERGPYTVFIPSDEAFAKLSAKQRSALKDPGAQSKALGGLVAAGKFQLKSAPEGTKIKTVDGRELVVHREGKSMKVNGIVVLEADVQVDNGVIHILDGVFP